MKEYAFMDSNVFIQLLYEGSLSSEAEELLDKCPLLMVSIGVVDEVLHFIIRREAMKKYDIKRAYDLRRLVQSKGISLCKGKHRRVCLTAEGAICENSSRY